MVVLAVNKLSVNPKKDVINMVMKIPQKKTS